MKKSRLLVVLALMGLVVGCGSSISASSLPSTTSTTSTTTSTTTSMTTSTTTSTTTSVSSEVTSTISSEPVSSELVVPDPDPTPTYEDVEPLTTRVYNELFDVYLNDFSQPSMLGTGTGTYLGAPYLLVGVNNSGAEKTGNTPNDAIYKYATGTYDVETYQIGFRMKLVAGSLPISQLRLGLRGSDAWNVYEVGFEDLFDADLEPMPALTTEYQDYVIDLNNSIEDDTVEYTIKDTETLSGTRVLNEILGIHLMVGDSTIAKVAISSVYLVKAGNVTILDDFNRVAVSAPDANCWWRGSVGSIVPRHVLLQATETYSVENTEATGFDNIVISAKGDFRGTTVAPIASGIKGTAVNWTAIKDADGNALPTTMHEFRNLIINFAESGFVGDVTGIEIVAGAKMSVNKMFFSDLVDKEAVKQYPYLDTENVVIFDDFNRTQSGFNGDYEASSTNPLITENGLYFALSYNNGSMVTIGDGSLLFDATSLGATDYIQFKEGSSRANTGFQYMVFAVKVTDGATLNEFRVGNGSAPVIYANDWKSAFGLGMPALDNAGYPYKDADGFTYLIIDMEETGFAVTDTLDMFYSGTGKLYIDQIFFANAMPKVDTITEYTIGEGGTADFTGGGYVYMYGGYNGDLARYLAITASGDGVANLESLRIGYGADTKWLKDGALLGVDGLPISDELTTDSREIIIDLVASGFIVAADHIHFHWGDYGTHNGVVTITKVVGYKDAVHTRYIDASTHAVTFNNTDYTYGFWANGTGASRYLALEVYNDGTAQFDNFRLEAGGTTFYADNSLVDINGVKLSEIVLTAETQTIYVDLIASGYNIHAITDMHFHFGGWGDHAGTITFTKIGFHDESRLPYGDIVIAWEAQTIPVIV